MCEQGESESQVLARTARGAGWVFGWRMVTRTLGLVNTLVLTRLLLPSDFGLVALGMGFAQAVDTFSTMGVQDAVIRERHPTREMYDTAFTMSAIRGVLSAALIEALAWPAAGFFNEPRLANILHALALGMLVTGFENVGVLEFRRDMTFDKEFRLFVAPRVCGIVLAITTAAIWHSYWALVVGILSTRVLRAILSYTMHPFRPRPGLRAWRRIIGFSTWIWAICVVGLIKDRVDEMTIGRVRNTTAVGMYAIGFEIAALPITELVEPLTRVCFSTFSAVHHMGASTGRTYLRVIATALLLTLPAGIGLALVADPLVKLAFGPNWASAIPVLQILALVGATSVFSQLSATMLSAHAMLGTSFVISAMATALRVALLLVLTTRFGIVGAATAAALATVLEQALFVVVIVRRFQVGWLALLAQIWRPVVATGVMAWALVSTGLALKPVSGPPMVLAGHLLVASGAGAAVFVLVMLCLWLAASRPAGAERDLMEILRRLLSRLPGWLRPGRPVPRPVE